MRKNTSFRPFFLFVVSVLLLGAGSMSVAVRGASAQATVRPGTLTGTVRDEGARPLADAIAVLDPGDFAKRVTTDGAGRYRLTGVKAGKHQLRVIRVGFRPFEQEVDVPDQGLEVDVVLTRFTQLDTLPIRAMRAGVFGKVLSKADFQPLDQVTVQVIGARVSSKTAADGTFDFPEVKEGAYLVRIERKGYDSRMLSIFVPAEGAVELGVVLQPGSSASQEKWLTVPLFEFGARARRRSDRSAIIPRQEFAGHYNTSVDVALRFSQSFLKSGLVVDGRECLYVDGQPKPGATAGDYSAGEVEAVEVYGMRADYTNTLVDRWPRGTPCGNTSTTRPVTSGLFGLQPTGFGSTRLPMDGYARAIVLWIRR